MKSILFSILAVVALHFATAADQPSASREILAAKRLLLFPVKNGAHKRRVEVLSDGKLERFFEIELADASPDWWAPLDVSAWQGKQLIVRVDQLPGGSQGLEQIENADEPKSAADLYHEPARAQFHFSPRVGWNNDPNGLVFAQGEYHLYFQNNPYGAGWGNMHWGHAVSTDLIHWQQLPIAIYPHAPGDFVYSGSAVVDGKNTSGWKSGDNDLLVAAYTSTGRGECIVYSNDRGRTWTEFAGNPVVKHSGRDPRLLWYEPTHEWVMAVYDEDMRQADKEQQRAISFYSSPDLHAWTFLSRIGGFFECPDLFPLNLDGDLQKQKWILTAASSDYMVGAFDGKKFTPETPKLKGQSGRGFYAAQTYSNEPKNRRIQIGWYQLPAPGASFNQAMTLPLELSLHSTPEGPRLAWQPAAETATLHSGGGDLKPLTLHQGDANPAANAHGELLEIRAEFKPEAGSRTRFIVRGVPIIYDADAQELSVGEVRARAPLQNGVQRIVVLADRNGFEVFASDGFTYIPLPILPKAENQSVELAMEKGAAEFTALAVYNLQSIWK